MQKDLAQKQNIETKILGMLKHRLELLQNRSASGYCTRGFEFFRSHFFWPQEADPASDFMPFIFLNKIKYKS